MPTATRERLVARVRPDRPPARQPVALRVPPALLEQVDAAAAHLHQDRTTFVLEAAAAKAAEVLRDRTAFRLSDQDFDRFVAALDNPEPPNRRLVELVHRKPLWERDPS